MQKHKRIHELTTKLADVDQFIEKAQVEKLQADKNLEVYRKQANVRILYVILTVTRSDKTLNFKCGYS